MTSFRSIVITAAIALAASAAAEEPAAAKPRHARLLALGDSPPFRQEIRDGVRYELDPPPGSIPPREVAAGFGEERSPAVPLRLGQIGPRIEVAAGENPLHLWRAEDAADANPWVTLKRPLSGDFLTLLWRKPGSRSWDEVSAATFPEAPAGMARVVNLFPQPVNIHWGSENLRLQAGASVLRPLPPEAPVALRILSRNAQGHWMRYYSGVVSANRDERCLVVILRADGVAPRRPLKVTTLREAVPATKPANTGNP